VIWFALRVAPQKEFVAERILRTRLRELEIAADVRVPVKHHIRRSVSMQARRAVRSRPFLPGIVLLGVNSIRDLPVLEIQRLALIKGFAAGENGSPLVLRDPDMIRILGELHQRPTRWARDDLPRRRRRKPGAELTIEDGPYAGRLARVLSRGAEVTAMTVTGTLDWFDRLPFDEPHNQRYKPAPDVPLAVAAAPRGDCSKGGPAETPIVGYRAECVPSSAHAHNPRLRRQAAR